MSDRWAAKVTALHAHTPGVNRVPLRAVAIIALLCLVNAVAWAAVGIALHFFPFLTGTAVLAYTLGLRHALDADHISAIDLMTRRLLASGQRPVTVGTFFSLGHSTIVIITSVVVAATAAAISDRFDSFSRIGGIIGSSVSSAFLLILGLANMYILFTLFQSLQRRMNPPSNDSEYLAAQEHARNEQALNFEGGGWMFRFFKKLFKLIDRPWKMYPLGVLFGLGFDTSSEVALLGLSSLQAAQGTSIWLILILPILFTCGMCLLDTVDGALMYSLYSSSFSSRDPFTVLYYNIILTGLTVAVAIVIGTLQVLGLILSVNDQLDGPFWDGVQNAQDSYDIIGGAVCATFLVVAVVSVICYRPWRQWIQKRMDRKRTLGSVDEPEYRDEPSSGSSPVVDPDATASSIGKSGTTVSVTGRGASGGHTASGEGASQAASKSGALQAPPE